MIARNKKTSDKNFAKEDVLCSILTAVLVVCLIAEATVQLFAEYLSSYVVSLVGYLVIIIWIPSVLGLMYFMTIERKPKNQQ